jgi:futalosine hydrolase
MIALLCSVQAEAKRLLDSVVVTRSLTAGHKSIIEGRLGNQEMLLCVGGMGKVNAAHAATLLLTRFEPELLLVFGIGGAYPSSGAKVGDVALASEEIAGDEGVLTQNGFRDAECIGIPLVKTAGSEIFSVFRASGPLVKRSLESLIAQKESRRDEIHAGPFVTLSTCTGTAARAQELEGRYHGLCENMEGAAAAQVAELHSVPWLEVRGISNIVEDRDLAKWDIPKAAEAVQRAVQYIVQGWDI